MKQTQICVECGIAPEPGGLVKLPVAPPKGATIDLSFEAPGEDCYAMIRRGKCGRFRWWLFVRRMRRELQY